MIKVVLFDLDGTLLPMDQDLFIKAYFGGLARKLAPYGYESEALVKAIWQGTAMMIKNDGQGLNEDVFWDVFAKLYNEEPRKNERLLDEFYQNEFDLVQNSCGFDKRARAVIDLVKKKGLRVALATNPVFPPLATQKRIKWAGLSHEEFELVTNYSNSRHCKPNPEYYLDIVRTLGVKCEECLMVGNDVREDMIARELGMSVFLLTPCLINKDNEDISKYPNGDFDALISFIEKINS